MKLFNYKFLKQNIKKSKGIISLLLFTQAIIQALFIVNVSNQSKYRYESISLELLDIVNILGMYIVPVIIAIVLFSYVYKRKSSDFIGSMPINRKTIYFTNYIGGVLLITIIQVLIFLVSIIFLKITNNIFYSYNMILNFFITGIVSYIFVFSATIVAMSISGNKITTVITTVLVVFLVPFLINFCIYNFQYNSNGLSTIKLLDKSNENSTILSIITKEYDYTLPYKCISIDSSSEKDLFNYTSNLKMFILSVLYTFVGYVLFRKRKMEYSEEGFENNYLHLIIKGLTLIPIIAVTSMTEPSISEIAFILAIMIIYYLIYDLITNKKVKFKIQIPAFILTCLLFYSCFGLIKKNSESIETKEYKKDDIEAVSISGISPIFYNYGYYGNNKIMNSLNQMQYKFTDKNIIDLIYNCTFEEYAIDNPSNDNGLIFDEDIIPEETNLDYYNEDYSYETNSSKLYHNYDNFIYVKYYMKDGKIAYKNVYTSTQKINEIANILIENESYINEAKKDIIINDKNAKITLQNIILNSEKQTEIHNQVNEFLSKNIDKVLKFNERNYKNYLRIYFYRKNNVHILNIPMGIDDKLDNYIVKEINEQTKKYLNEIKNKKNISSNINYEVYENDIYSTYFSDKVINNQNLIKYIINSKETIDFTKKYYRIDIRTEDYTFSYYINNLNEILQKLQ